MICNLEQNKKENHNLFNNNYYSFYDPIKSYPFAVLSDVQPYQTPHLTDANTGIHCDLSLDVHSSLLLRYGIIEDTVMIIDHII